MERSVKEWQRRFRGMSVEQITRTWSAKAANNSSWSREVNFHIAAAERMKLLGNMAIDLDRETRVHLCRQANAIIERLQGHLSVETERLQEIDFIIQESDEYFQKFGSRTARHYMYENGLIDRLGDKIHAA